MKITVNGDEFEIPYKRIRLDALFEKVGLDPLEDKLALVDPDRRKMVEFCSLHYIIEIFDDMCFVTCRWRGERNDVDNI